MASTSSWQKPYSSLTFRQTASRFLRLSDPCFLKLSPSPGRGFPVLRLNALPVVEFPSQCRLVDCGIGGQQEVNEALEKSGENVLAARRSVGVLAFGTDAAVRRIFSSHGIRAFDLYPLDLASLASQPSEVSLLSDAITLAFARGRALTVSRRGRGRFLCADPAKETTRELSLSGPLSRN